MNTSALHTSLSHGSLCTYLHRQIELHFPDGCTDWHAALEGCVERALERLEYCFSHIHKKYYYDNGTPCFSHLNGDHYASFLYFVSHEAGKANHTALAERVFYLNKILHGLDLFYSVELPDIFMLVHPVGTVIGHGHFSDYLVIYQNVTIGSDTAGIYPTFAGDNVIYSGASVIGDTRIGCNSVIGAKAFVRNSAQAGSNLIYTGTFPANRLVPNKGNVRQDFFGQCASVSAMSQS